MKHIRTYSKFLNESVSYIPTEPDIKVVLEIIKSIGEDWFKEGIGTPEGEVMEYRDLISPQLYDIFDLAFSGPDDTDLHLRNRELISDLTREAEEDGAYSENKDILDEIYADNKEYILEERAGIIKSLSNIHPLFKHIFEKDSYRINQMIENDPDIIENVIPLFKEAWFTPTPLVLGIYKAFNRGI